MGWAAFHENPPRVLTAPLAVTELMFKFRFTRLLMWMGLAAVATYLLDPDRGEQRRKNVRKQMGKVQKAGKKAKVEAGL
jgi:hypothetical protein